MNRSTPSSVLLSSPAADLAGITYRQLDHWVRRGFLDPERLNGGTGSGRFRSWSLPEFAVLCRMAALVEVGYTPERAAVIAREGLER